MKSSFLESRRRKIKLNSRNLSATMVEPCAHHARNGRTVVVWASEDRQTCGCPILRAKLYDFIAEAVWWLQLPAGQSLPPMRYTTHSKSETWSEICRKPCAISSVKIQMGILRTINNPRRLRKNAITFGEIPKLTPSHRALAPTSSSGSRFSQPLAQLPDS